MLPRWLGFVIAFAIMGVAFLVNKKTDSQSGRVFSMVFGCMGILFLIALFA